MPIYEYRCNECKSRFALMVGVTKDKMEDICPKCKSKDISRIISAFRPYKSHTEILDVLDKKFENIDTNDPKSMTRAMKEMGRYISDEASNDNENSNIDEMLDSAEKEVYNNKL